MLFPEKRLDNDTETIVIQQGWRAGVLEIGYFCLVKRNDICVEAFGTTRRSALRYARRAWRKEKIETTQRELGYPRVVKCPDKFPRVIKHEFNDDYRNISDPEG